MQYCRCVCHRKGKGSVTPTRSQAKSSPKSQIIQTDRIRGKYTDVRWAQHLWHALCEAAVWKWCSILILSGSLTSAGGFRTYFVLHYTWLQANTPPTFLSFGHFRLMTGGKGAFLFHTHLSWLSSTKEPRWLFLSPCASQWWKFLMPNVNIFHMDVLLNVYTVFPNRETPDMEACHSIS